MDELFPQIKRKIEKSYNIPKDTFELVFDGNGLSNNKKSEDYNIYCDKFKCIDKTFTINVKNIYYETNKTDEKVHPELRKEAIIDTEYVYVYDETKFENDKTSFSLHCPNCGAPIRDINTVCSYCTAEVIPINFRAWKINKIIIK